MSRAKAGGHAGDQQQIAALTAFLRELAARAEADRAFGAHLLDPFRASGLPTLLAEPAPPPRHAPYAGPCVPRAPATLASSTSCVRCAGYGELGQEAHGRRLRLGLLHQTAPVTAAIKNEGGTSPVDESAARPASVQTH